MAWNKYTRVVRLGIKQYLSVLKTEKSHAALCVSACSVGGGGLNHFHCRLLREFFYNLQTPS